MDDRDLTRLLDEAAAAYEPVPSPGRLALALAPRPTGARRLYLVLGVAAGLTVLGAGAAALTGAETAIRTPADQFEVDVTIERGIPIATTTAPGRTTDDKTAVRRPRLIAAPLIEQRDPAARELADHVVLQLHEPTLPTHESTSTTIAATTTTTPPTTTVVPAPIPATTQPPATTNAPATTQPPAPDPAPTTTVHHEPPPTTTQLPHQDPPPTTTSPAIEFRAHQYWGSCNSDPPYDEFEGRATPGSTVSISSPYGSSSTTADAHGNWYVKVLVPDAPVGETFQFVAASSAGGSATFSFVRTG